ncbi:hypothetical protein BH09PAT1_BH09PAT1_2090 [soil metagenome]
MKLIDYCDKIIRWSFYLLLFFVPLVLTSNTSELFELNKMWLTWGLAIVIIGSWIIKMSLQRKFLVRRTPLDIPILLFLLSQLISTIFSLDSHISFWGYYSRFNGGFLSLLTYTLLYYAFVSNSSFKDAKRYLYVTLLSSIVVVLWGLPSHFGYDPTCLMFRGTLDTSCWTESFKPTIRIFSTLGQPAWMAAYTSTLLPIVMALTIWQKEKIADLSILQSLKKPKIIGLILLTFFMYLDLLYTDTRAGFLAFWAANAMFWAILLFIKLFPIRKLLTYFIAINALFLFCNFTSGTPIAQLNRFSLRTLHATAPTPATTAITSTTDKPATSPPPTLNITDSGDIRLLVWSGALDAWKAHPIIGTGVETFAFAYYMYRPAAHNLTSEWDYLYNKAHNEYLNYLATTGALGLGTHLLLLLGFFIISLKEVLKIQKNHSEHTLKKENRLYVAAFPGAMLSIIISNFFGFSVVIMNLFLYFLPLWLFYFSGLLEHEKFFGFSFIKNDKKYQSVNAYQWTTVIGVAAISLFFIYKLLVFWNADVAYALGTNYDHVGDYQTAYPSLTAAVQERPGEPVFKDELSVNLATLGTALIQSNNATNGAQLAQQAVQLSNDVITSYPDNVVFWKTRVRVFYLLAQVNPAYYSQALDAILHAKKLAPSDAKISYNVGVLYGQNNMVEDGIKELSATIKLKPNYRDAYYARAIFYHQLSQKATGQQAVDFNTKAVTDMHYILNSLVPADPDVMKVLTSWGEK